MKKLNSVSCATDYSKAATLEWVYQSNGGYFTVSGADVWMELQYGPQGSEDWTDEVHVPTGNGILQPGTIGIRFRNYSPGTVATVSAGISEHAEPAFALSASGSLQSTVSGIPVYNVQAFGAGGQGITSGDAWQSIMDAYNKMSPGGILYFPEGQYLISQPLTFNRQISFSIWGAGMGVSQILPNYVNGDGIVIAPGGNSSIVNLQDFDVFGYYGPQTKDNYLLKVSGLARLNMDNVSLANESGGGSLSLSSIPFVALNKVSGIEFVTPTPCLRIDGCGGTIDQCNFAMAPNNDMSTRRPVAYLSNLNSLHFNDCQFGGFGPRETFAITSIASTPTTFTVTCGAHDYKAGDPVVIRNSNVAGYNNTWLIDSVTATTFTVKSVLNPGAAGAFGTAETLACAVYAPNDLGPVNEVTISNTLSASEAEPQTYGRCNVMLDGNRGAYLLTGWNLGDNYYDGAEYGVVTAGGVNASGQPAGVSITGGNHNNVCRNLMVLGTAQDIEWAHVSSSASTSGDDGINFSCEVLVMCVNGNPNGPMSIHLDGHMDARFPNTGSPTFYPRKYGVILDDNGQAQPPQDIVIDGKIFGTVGALLINDTGSSRHGWRINLDDGCNVNWGTVPATNANYLPSVASAATVDLSAVPNRTIKITGPVNIQNLNGGWLGRRVSLLFVSGLTILSGGNFAIAANRTVLAGDQLECVFDGASWYVR